MCSVVVLDDVSSFKGLFMEIYKALDLIYWCLSQRNHRGISVKRYYRCFNKTQAITNNIRATHDVYLEKSKNSQYTWNITPIDNTDITRSMAAISRYFRFPLGVELSQTLMLNNETTSTLFQYL